MQASDAGHHCVFKLENGTAKRGVKLALKSQILFPQFSSLK
jgi:hypothetical protein